MKRFLQIALWFLLTFLPLQTAEACEEFHTLSTSELKEFRDKLVESDADPLDRLFAFGELICSDNPTIRDYAVRTGLTNAKDPLVRNQIMFEAMMQKSRIDIELSKSSSMKTGDKKFYDTYSGVYSRIVTFRDTASGCIGISFNTCNPRAFVIVKGDTVEYTHGSTSGFFKLTEQNELVGFLKPDDRSNYSKIPATIRLF